MDMRGSIRWAAMGAGILTGAVALAFFLGHWHTRSRDEHGRALVAEAHAGPVRSRGQD